MTTNANDDNPLLPVEGHVLDAPDISVQFAVERTIEDGWLVVRNGRLSVGNGRGVGAALYISCGPGDHVANQLALLQSDTGNISNLEIRSEPGQWAPHPPFDVDVGQQPLPEIPRANVIVRHITSESIVGTLDFCDIFRNGKLVERTTQLPKVIDVTAHHSFRQLTSAYDPGLNSIEAVTGMRIEARHPSLLMVAAGLYDDREFRSYLFARAHENRLLADLGSVVSAIRDIER